MQLATRKSLGGYLQVNYMAKLIAPISSILSSDLKEQLPSKIILYLLFLSNSVNSDLCFLFQMLLY